MSEECGMCRGEGISEYFQRMTDHVEKEGSTFVIGVGGMGPPDEEGGSPPFAYTVGMWRNFGMPELCIHGLPPESATGILNTVREEARKGTVFELGKKHSEIAEGFHTVFAEIKGEDNVFNFTRMYYRERGKPEDKDFPRWQLIWPDEFNVFPWEDGFNERFRNLQPKLGEWPTHIAPEKGEEENGEKDHED